jgi:hypothetical protein
LSNKDAFYFLSFCFFIANANFSQPSDSSFCNTPQTKRNYPIFSTETPEEKLSNSEHFGRKTNKANPVPSKPQNTDPKEPKNNEAHMFFVLPPGLGVIQRFFNLEELRLRGEIVLRTIGHRK